MAPGLPTGTLASVMGIGALLSTRTGCWHSSRRRTASGEQTRKSWGMPAPAWARGPPQPPMSPHVDVLPPTGPFLSSQQRQAGSHQGKGLDVQEVRPGRPQHHEEVRVGGRGGEGHTVRRRSYEYFKL